MKIAVVTGASSGIGKSVAVSLLKENYKVYGISRSDPDISQQNFTWLQMNLTNSQEIDLLKNKIAEDHIDVLINNAGIAYEKPSLSPTLEVFETIFNLNFKASILVTSNLIDKLKNSLVINISSISDRIPGEGFALYCSSKAALNSYFDVVALEHKELKVINILPDYVDTPLLRKLQNVVDFDWNQTLKPGEIAEFLINTINNHGQIPSGSRIIIINEALKEDLDYKETHWVYNTDTKNLARLS